MGAFERFERGIKDLCPRSKKLRPTVFSRCTRELGSSVIIFLSVWLRTIPGPFNPCTETPFCVHVRSLHTKDQTDQGGHGALNKP